MDSLDESTILSVLGNIKNENKYDIRLIISVLSTCAKMYKYMYSDLLWEQICTQFHDYSRLCAYNIARGISWWQTYMDRISALLSKHEALVGDPNAPEYSIIIYIYGNGDCYYEDSRSRQLEPPLLESGIIDAHVNGCSVVLLRENGIAIERLYMPSYANDFKAFAGAHTVKVPDDIAIVRTLPIANFAISKTNKVYVWTIIDHPITMEKIRTEPLHLNAIDAFPNKYDITSINDYIRLHYRTIDVDRVTCTKKFNNKYIDLPNDQIYLLLLESLLSEEDFQQLHL